MSEHTRLEEWKTQEANAHAHTPAASTAFCLAFKWMAENAHRTARKSQFWQARDAVQECCDAAGLGGVARKLIDSQLRELIISEVSEACEGDRKDLMDDKIPAFTMVEAELADCIIRIGDYCKARGLRVAQAVVAKMLMNETREPMHGKKF